MATLTIDHVTKLYRPKGRSAVKAVDDLDMATTDGEIIGLLGSSGCGKTSTLRMIAGFEDVTQGAISLGSRKVNQLAPADRNVAMAFEGYALYPPLTVGDNIGFGLLRDRRPKAEIEAKVKSIAEMLEIGDILKRYPPTISGGQQQRVSLARALARRADLYLLDEPMSQLEPQLRAVLRARIKEYLIENRMTSVFVTHDQTEAIALADRIAVMEGGVLEQYATPAELKRRPANLFVASFIGEPPMNIMKARIDQVDGRLRIDALTDSGTMVFGVTLPPPEQARVFYDALRPGSDLRLGVRPHEVMVGAGPIAGTVVSNQWLGDQTHLGLDIGGYTLLTVADGAIDAPVDSVVRADVPFTSLHLFDAATGVALVHGLDGVGSA